MTEKEDIACVADMQVNCAETLRQHMKLIIFVFEETTIESLVRDLSWHGEHGGDAFVKLVPYSFHSAFILRAITRKQTWKGG